MRYDTIQPPASSQSAIRTPQSAIPTGLRKVSLGGIAKKEDDGAVEYPILPDPHGKASELAARIAERQDQFDALKSALTVDKAELAQTIVRPWYFDTMHGRSDAPSSVIVKFPLHDASEPTKVVGTGAVRVTVKDQYYTADEAAVTAILGEERAASLFQQTFTLEIDGDRLPQDRAQEIVERLQALFAEHGCADALSVKDGIRPVNDFLARRLRELTKEESLALETIGDKGLTQVSVTTKNVRT